MQRTNGDALDLLDELRSGRLDIESIGRMPAGPCPMTLAASRTAL
jgi:hypothetical protein